MGNPSTVRVLVTGASGFIGGRILQKNDVSDLIFCGASRLALPHAPCASIIDWTDGGSIERACQDIDAIINLAGPTERVAALSPTDAYSFAKTGTQRLMDAARRTGVQRVIQASSIKVHGRSLQGVVDTNTVVEPTTPYGRARLIAEEVALDNAGPGLDVCVTRISNVIGAPASAETDCWELLASNLCRMAAEQHAIVLHSNGLATRNFIAMVDVSAAFEHLLRVDGAVIRNKTILLGGPTSLRIIDLAHLVASRSRLRDGVDVTVRAASSVSAPGDEIPYTVSQRSLAEVGFAPGVPIDNAIDECLSFCEQAFGTSQPEDPRA